MRQGWCKPSYKTIILLKYRIKLSEILCLKLFQEGALRFIFKATSCLNIILYPRRCGGARKMQGSKLLGQKEHIISTPKV